jgi:uncharacterized protein (DUF885 family)
MSAVRAIADRYLETLAPHEPAAAQALGRQAADRLQDFSPEWAEARRALDASVADELRALDPAGLDAADRPLHAAMLERLDSDVSLFDTGFTPRLLAPLATPVHFVREAFDDTLVTADEAGDAVLARLSAVPSTMTDLRRRLEWSRDQGELGRFSGGGVAGLTQVTVVADQIASWIDPDGMDYFGSLRTQGLDASRAERLASLVAAATAAFSDFERFLRTELAPAAPTVDAVGEEVYQATARAFLGSDLDLDDIYAYGWSELERLVAESRRIASEITGSQADEGVIARAVAALTASGDQALSGDVAIAAWLRARVDQTIAHLDGTAFDLPSDIGEVECVVTEAASGVVYYLPGAPDGSSASKIVWTIPRGLSSIATWHEVTSVHHEGVPGHHLEHAINRANTSLHPWQRYLCEVHGYAEGWAHYAEGLADELGLIRSQEERLGMVLGQIWRSVRIVADLGLHTDRPIPENSLTDATSWTPELARSFLRDLAMTDAHTAAFEVDRYFGWPGQALAFKVGAKLWLDAREQSRRLLGADFDLTRFHREALGVGPMGLGPLRSTLLGDR